MDEEVAHIKAINAYHIRVGYGGFGYNAIAFGSGRVYVVGEGLGRRAHVANRNHELEGIVMAGNFSNDPPPLGCILGAGRWVKAKEKQHNRAFPIMGHRQVAVAGWETACPGNAGMASIQKIWSTSAALQADEKKKLAEEVKKKIANSLMPNVLTANLDGLADQIAFLTGNRRCKP